MLAFYNQLSAHFVDKMSLRFSSQPASVSNVLSLHQVLQVGMEANQAERERAPSDRPEKRGRVEPPPFDPMNIHFELKLLLPFSWLDSRYFAFDNLRDKQLGGLYGNISTVEKEDGWEFDEYNATTWATYLHSTPLTFKGNIDDILDAISRATYNGRTMLNIPLYTLAIETVRKVVFEKQVYYSAQDSAVLAYEDTLASSMNNINPAYVPRLLDQIKNGANGKVTFAGLAILHNSLSYNSNHTAVAGLDEKLIAMQETASPKRELYRLWTQINSIFLTVRDSKDWTPIYQDEVKEYMDNVYANIDPRPYFETGDPDHMLESGHLASGTQPMPLFDDEEEEEENEEKTEDNQMEG